MFRRFQQFLQTRFFDPSASEQAHLCQNPAQKKPSHIHPPLQLPDSLTFKQSDKKVHLPPIPRPMGPLITPPSTRIPSPPAQITPMSQESKTPSLAEICAEQAPTPLMQILHEQARWFYTYPSSRKAISPSKITCQPLPTLLDYQRLQIKVEHPNSTYISLNLEIANQPDALVLIGDIQPGQFSGNRVRIPTNCEVEVCFRIFSNQETSCAIKLSPLEADSNLAPVISENCFNTKIQHNK